MKCLRKTLQACSFPPWILNSLHNKFNCKHNICNGQNSTDKQPNNNNNSGTNYNNNKKISLVVPYIHGLGEGFKRTRNNMGIQVQFKGINTIKALLMTPRERDSKLQNSGVIYKFKCPHINCPEEYREESGRTFGDRFKEHLKTLSPIHHHSNCTGHPVSPNSLIIVDR